ncbi:LysM peptidoglycan-binding domain-containing protein [Gryllotalpicola sp.]|uniref:LysM peptidoglycan-binding domain-containing protein n=1 Tax=Gryllotalpicola sp. TaxID=1932787 RepID=UPI00262DA029|nr:LysM peptidoglycan-binding domain-containing protein [Gryllotalpicola sp.]
MSTIATGVYAPARGAMPGMVGVREAVVRSRLRLTRRGRAVVAAVIVTPVIVTLAVLGLSGGNAAASTDPSNVSFQHVTVQQGESLWQIAETIAPDADPRVVITAIVDLNQLASATVFAGESLAVPTQYSH